MDSIHHRRTKGQRASVDSYHPCEYTHSLLLPVYLTQPPTLSPTRIISITDTDQSSTTALTTLLITTSNRYYWLRIATPLLTTLELSSFLSTIILFATALSLAISLSAFDPPSLPTLDSADLTSFTHLLPLSRGLALTAALILPPSFLALALTLHALQQRRREGRDTRAFEPTVSALGMSHGFHALHPQPRGSTLRQPIPTMYDPYKAFQKGPGGGALRITKQVAFADEATWMSDGGGAGKQAASSRWSASSTGSPRRVEGGRGANVVRLLDVRKASLPRGEGGGGADVTRLLDVKRARRAVPVRPVGDAGMELRSSGNCI